MQFWMFFKKYELEADTYNQLNDLIETHKREISNLEIQKQQIDRKVMVDFAKSVET